MDAEDYSSSGAKLTWRLINKVIDMSYVTFHIFLQTAYVHHKGHAVTPLQLLHCHRRSESRRK